MIWRQILLTNLIFADVSKVRDDGVLAPKYFNLAKGSRIHATATCGELKPEVFCKLSAGSDYMANRNTKIKDLWMPTGTEGQVNFKSKLKFQILIDKEIIIHSKLRKIVFTGCIGIITFQSCQFSIFIYLLIIFFF
jgi:hypothetical protein